MWRGRSLSCVNLGRNERIGKSDKMCENKVTRWNFYRCDFLKESMFGFTAPGSRAGSIYLISVNNIIGGAPSSIMYYG